MFYWLINIFITGYLQVRNICLYWQNWWLFSWNWYFKPCFAIYSSIVCLLVEYKLFGYISGCTFIDAEEFVDCVINCRNLQKLEMIAFTQFDGMHIVTMSEHMPKLAYLDIEKSCLMTFDAVLTVVINMTNLLWLNFNPKDVGSGQFLLLFYIWVLCVTCFTMG